MPQVDKLSFEQFVNAVRAGELTLEQLISIAKNQPLSLAQDTQVMEAAKQSNNDQYQPFIAKMEKWKKEHGVVEVLGARGDLRDSLVSGSNLGTSWVDYARADEGTAPGIQMLKDMHANRAKAVIAEPEQKEPSKPVPQKAAPATVGRWNWGLWKQEKPNPALPKIGANKGEEAAAKPEDSDTNSRPRSNK